MTTLNYPQLGKMQQELEAAGWKGEYKSPNDLIYHYNVWVIPPSYANAVEVAEIVCNLKRGMNQWKPVYVRQ